jgi:hypothetical protein
VQSNTVIENILTGQVDTFKYLEVRTPTENLTRNTINGIIIKLNVETVGLCRKVLS